MSFGLTQVLNNLRTCVVQTDPVGSPFLSMSRDPRREGGEVCKLEIDVNSFVRIDWETQT